MTWWHRLLRRRQMEKQLEKELRFHLDQGTADLIARGYLLEEARRQARLALGGPEQVKKECRRARGTRWLEDLSQDVRYALRALRQGPALPFRCGKMITNSATGPLLLSRHGIRSRSRWRNSVTPDYLEVMGIPLRKGRFSNEHDRIGNERW